MSKGTVKEPFVGSKWKKAGKLLGRDEGFVVKHYAGEVQYESANWVEKNMSKLRDEAELLITNSSNKIVNRYLVHNPVARANANISSSSVMDLQRNKKDQKQTVSSTYLNNLFSLLQTLGKSSLYYIRCFKPNENKMQDQFMGGLVVRQLIQSGTTDLVRVMHDGFPNRMEYKQIAWIFKDCFWEGFAERMDPENSSLKLLWRRWYRAGLSKRLTSAKDWRVCSWKQARCSWWIVWRQTKHWKTKWKWSGERHVPPNIQKMSQYHNNDQMVVDGV